jgi:hypothetical protein
MGEFLRKSLLIVASIGLIAATSACSSAPKTITAQGTITSSTPASLKYRVGGQCEGMGNDSLQEGKEYKITADGKTLAIGKFGKGVGIKGSRGVDCEFKFSQDVPAGMKFYTLDLGEYQGHKEFSEADLSKGITIDRIDMDGRK